ncbi:MAG TPA: hypothetical protein VMG59_00140 [Phycisphaerae bacterium]|nr:hypothetical protein [Phycisphaerae bacterium]
MKIVDLFRSKVMELPRARPSGDFEVFLDDMFNKYVEEIKKLEGNDPTSTSIRNSLPDIINLCNCLRNVVRTYFKGITHDAFEHFRVGVENIAVRRCLENLESVGDISPHLQSLYRIRCGTLEWFKRKDIFHIPFELRHKVATQRYSIPGLPALYLGGSLWICWEELGRPDFHTMQLSQFRPTKGSKIKLLNFGYPPAMIPDTGVIHAAQSMGLSKSGLYVISYIVCWPIIAACSIKVHNPRSPFIPEYIVPQLLIQWLQAMHKLDGLRYFSTIIEQSPSDPEAMMNYVFPVKTIAPKRYCKILRNKFELTSPVAWSILTQAEIPRGIMIGAGSWKMPLTQDESVIYSITEFFQCESKLKVLKFAKVRI